MSKGLWCGEHLGGHPSWPEDDANRDVLVTKELVLAELNQHQTSIRTPPKQRNLNQNPIKLLHLQYFSQNPMKLLQQYKKNSYNINY
jgi:hypothetical protein